MEKSFLQFLEPQRSPSAQWLSVVHVPSPLLHGPLFLQQFQMSRQFPFPLQENVGGGFPGSSYLYAFLIFILFQTYFRNIFN